MATMVTLSVGNDATTDMWWRPVDMTHVAVATGVLQVVLPLLTARTTVTVTNRFFSCVNIRFILEAKGSLRPPLFFAAGATESYATLVRLFSYYDLPVTLAFCWRFCFSFGVSEKEIRVRTRANRANLRQTSCRAQRQGLWGLEALRLRLRGFGVWGFKDFALQVFLYEFRGVSGTFAHAGFNAFRFDGELEPPTMACFVGHKAPALGFRVQAFRVSTLTLGQSLARLLVRRSTLAGNSICSC